MIGASAKSVSSGILRDAVRSSVIDDGFPNVLIVLIVLSGNSHPSSLRLGLMNKQTYFLATKNAE